MLTLTCLLVCRHCARHHSVPRHALKLAAFSAQELRPREVVHYKPIQVRARCSKAIDGCNL